MSSFIAIEEHVNEELVNEKHQEQEHQEHQEQEHQELVNEELVNEELVNEEYQEQEHQEQVNEEQENEEIFDPIKNFVIGFISFFVFMQQILFGVINQITKYFISFVSFFVLIKQITSKIIYKLSSVQVGKLVKSIEPVEPVKIVFEDMEKQYETYLSKSKVTIFRLDGHGFSKFTSNFTKPFDGGFTEAMKQTAKIAFNYYKFSIGFVGSDEITFCIFPHISKTGELSDIEFNGRIQKMTTLLAGFVSVAFYKEFSKFYPMDSFTPHFDCRVYQLDSIKDTLLNISSRVTYTLKNSRMMFAQSYFSAKKLHKLSSRQAIELVKSEKDIDYYQVISGDNRVGCVVYSEKIPYVKEIVVKGEIKQIEYTRNIPQLVNLSSGEVLDLIVRFE
jgi:tRNA(His) guanylyltransferase